MEGVEGVDELLLGLRLALERLDVVDQKRVDVAVAALESGRPVLAQARHELGREALRSGAMDGERRLPIAEVVGDGTQEVGFPKARRAVEEERVVGLTGQFGDGERRRMGEAVTGPAAFK